MHRYIGNDIDRQIQTDRQTGKDADVMKNEERSNGQTNERKIGRENERKNDGQK
jgi:hypothetical protein